MFLLSLILIPLVGIFIILSTVSYQIKENTKILKIIALSTSLINLTLSLVVWILFDNNDKHYQFVQEQYSIGYYDFYLGIDGFSIYFVLLTTLIMPLSIISNWKSIDDKIIYFLTIILLLESLLLIIFMVLDILMFYIFFESILAPLFLLIGIFGSSEKLRASFYFFLYTFLGSLFMLLSIISMLSLIGCTDFDVLSKTNFGYITQLFMFLGIFIAFAVKTPTIYLNSWLLKAHVESPLSGSIILAAIVLKLSLYGIFRLILPLVPKAFLYYTYIVFLIGVVTIIYASLSTLRTLDVKELIAYSSVSHAAVYLAGVFSNTLHGIQGGIALGLAHGFVSSGLFTSAGGVLYDRSGTRAIIYYKGMAQVMPIFSLLFFMLSLGNCGAPLTLNFIGEFLSLYGIFERLPLSGILASSSIVFSAAYTIYMYNRICYGGNYPISLWKSYLSDLNKREFSLLLTLVLFAIVLGIYPSIILDALHYTTYNLLYSFDALFDNVAFRLGGSTISLSGPGTPENVTGINDLQGAISDTNIQTSNNLEGAARATSVQASNNVQGAAIATNDQISNSVQGAANATSVQTSNNAQGAVSPTSVQTSDNAQRPVSPTLEYLRNHVWRELPRISEGPNGRNWLVERHPTDQNLDTIHLRVCDYIQVTQWRRTETGELYLYSQPEWAARWESVPRWYANILPRGNENND